LQRETGEMKSSPSLINGSPASGRGSRGTLAGCVGPEFPHRDCLAGRDGKVDSHGCQDEAEMGMNLEQTEAVSPGYRRLA
jgi:hypothetical protein